MKGGAIKQITLKTSEPSYVRRATLTSAMLFQGKWKVQILCALRAGPIRIGQLARVIPGASKKMLVQSLRKLEADGIVVRRDLSDVVLHIEYVLDDGAHDTVCDLLDHLARWGDLYLGKSAASLITLPVTVDCGVCERQRTVFVTTSPTGPKNSKSAENDHEMETE